MFTFDAIYGHLLAVITQLFSILSYTCSGLTRQHNVNLNVSRCILNVSNYFIVLNELYI